MTELERLLAEIRACRVCAPDFAATPTAHAPRPVLQPGPAAPVLIAGQAPGWRAHRAGIPFDDPSGDRLRDWLGVDRAAFYDPERFAILPMAFCFPGHDAKGGDKPPPRICADLWRSRLLAEHPTASLVLLVGGAAQAWSLGRGRPSVADRVRAAGNLLAASAGAPGDPRFFPLPHPSWRTTAWRAARPWFDAEILPMLRAEIARLIPGGAPRDRD